MSGKDNYEKAKNNTYGIEIEFGTHDNYALGFTHIEVCMIGPDVKSSDDNNNSSNQNDSCWKIETDSDYTFELVSPILKFDTQQNARKFRDDLSAFLEKEVRTGILLGTLVAEFIQFLNSKEWIITKEGIWKQFNAEDQKDDKEGTPVRNLIAKFITFTNLSKDLEAHNWDEDVDLERVLAMKKVMSQQLNTGDAIIKNILVTKSRKHGGLPSSQMNIPLTLGAYVDYQTQSKRLKAWDRLLEDKTPEQAYIDKKMKSLDSAYPDLIHPENSLLKPSELEKGSAETWKKKYYHKDYIESQIDEKTPFWHRYWLWLQTFYISALVIETELKSNTYIETIDNIVSTYCDHVIAKHQLRSVLRLTELKEAQLSTSENKDQCSLYLTLEKLVSGALSELSETLQSEAQKKIMELRGAMSMDQIRYAIPDNQFMQFHYALKDLTSLWFKAPLFDVFDAEGTNLEILEGRLFPGNFKLEELITNILRANLKLLGWYYGICEANNQGFDYDWEDFCNYNMPSIPAFRESLAKSCQTLKTELPKPKDSKQEDSTIISRLNKNSKINIVFLQRTYKTDTSVKKIAPWEGRWDTMKRVLTMQDTTRYLVEHRNN